MKVVFAARTLNPGGYEAFRKALRPGALAAYMDAATDAVGDRMPPELVHFIAMSEAGRPEHLIQLGIFRTNDPAVMRESSQGTGIDSTR